MIKFVPLVDEHGRAQEHPAVPFHFVRGILENGRLRQVLGVHSAAPGNASMDFRNSQALFSITAHPAGPKSTATAVSPSMPSALADLASASACSLVPENSW